MLALDTDRFRVDVYLGTEVVVLVGPASIQEPCIWLE